MPDISSAPAIPPPTSLYPQPPAAAPALSGNPAQLLDLIGSITKNQMLQNELRGRQALGQAYQGALQPDGTLDPEKLRSGLSDPAASWMLPEAMTHVLSQQGAQLNLKISQDQAVKNLLGSLPPNATDEQLRQVRAQLVRILGPSAAPMIEGWWDGIRRAPNRAGAIADVKNLALTPAESSARVPGPPGTEGEPTSVSVAQANRANPQGMPIGTPLGAPESSALMQHDLARARNFGQEMLPWNEALSAVNDFEAKGGKFGPGAEARQDFQAFIQSLSPKLAAALGIDERELADFAKAKKYLAQGLQTRAAGFGTGTADHLATTAAGTPNVHVTDLALPDLIKMNIAARRAEQAQTMDSRKAGPSGYSDAAGSWSSKNDIRAFALDQLSPEARTKLLGSLKKGTPEYTRFNSSLRAAYEHGLMTPPGKESEQPHPAATKAPDGNWYLPDPRRPGKVMKVTPSMLPQLGG